jgi:predicted RNA-binding Zn-ribbon protein involved in translation (DUF1610 family)
MSQVLKFFGMENKGGNYVTCKNRIKELNIDSSHFLNRLHSSILTKEVSKDEFLTRLVEHSPHKRVSTKKYLIKFNLLPYKCSKCSNEGQWNNLKLSLQLEHKNGVSDDDRIENLEFLCPNCHSQTSTFAGKKHKKYYFCKECGKPSKGYSNNDICAICSNENRRKQRRPSKEDLIALIKIHPILTIAKQYNISDNTLRKWCVYYNIDWKNISRFSRRNRIKKITPISRVFPSKYLYVSFSSSRNKWIANVKKQGKIQFSKRFNDELTAAKSVADFLGSNQLIFRKTNLSVCREKVNPPALGAGTA